MLVLRTTARGQTDKNNRIVKRENTEHAPSIELAKVVRVTERVEENTCNEKSGEDEEEINSRGAKAHKIDDWRKDADGITRKEMRGHYSKHGNTTNAV